MEILLILAIIWGIRLGKKELKEVHAGEKPGVQPEKESTWIFGIFDV